MVLIIIPYAILGGRKAALVRGHGMLSVLRRRQDTVADKRTVYGSKCLRALCAVFAL